MMAAGKLISTTVTARLDSILRRRSERWTGASERILLSSVWLSLIHSSWLVAAKDDKVLCRRLVCFSKSSPVISLIMTTMPGPCESARHVQRKKIVPCQELQRCLCCTLPSSLLHLHLPSVARLLIQTIVSRAVAWNVVLLPAMSAEPVSRGSLRLMISSTGSVTSLERSVWESISSNLTLT